MKVLISLLCLSFAAHSQSPVVVTRVVAMEYPWFARIVRLQAKVELAATIKGGSATNIRVVSGPLVHSDPAKENLAKWRFSGCSECEAKFVFTFELEGSCDASAHCPTGFEVDLPGSIKVTAPAINAIVN